MMVTSQQFCDFRACEGEFFLYPIFLFWEPEPAQKITTKKKYG